MYLERKIHSGFVGSLFIIATLVLFFFHTRPVRQELTALRTQVDALQQEVAGNPDATEKLSASGISEVEQKAVTKAIPETLEQDTIINDINRLAKAAQVNFNGLTFSLLQQAEVPTITISAGFQGPSPNIIRFLKSLEQNQRKLVIREAGISRAEQTPGLDIVTLNATIQAFYRTSQ